MSDDSQKGCQVHTFVYSQSAHLPNVKICEPGTVFVRLAEVEIAAGAAAIGKTLRELDLRRATGTTVLAVRRGREVTANPAADTVLAEGDRLVIMTDATCEGRAREALGRRASQISVPDGANPS